MSTSFDDLFSKYPALAEHLVPPLKRSRRAGKHPLVAHLRADKLGPFFMQFLENLLGSAAGSAAGFDRLVRKLADAPDGNRFLDAVAELTVVSRLIRLGASDVGLVPTATKPRPDVIATLAAERMYFEVTRLTGMNPRQRAQKERLDTLKAALEAFTSPFDITFRPGAEYQPADVEIVERRIREVLINLEAAGTLPAGAAETYVFPPPRFSISVSLKAGKTTLGPGTKFRLSAELVLASAEGHDERKLLDKIVEKYRQCVPGTLNVVVIQPANDGLDEAAQTLALEFLGQRDRSRLTAVVVLSSWPGRSLVRANPGARPAASPQLLEALTELSELDDDIWTSGAGTLLSGKAARKEGGPDEGRRRDEIPD